MKLNMMIAAITLALFAGSCGDAGSESNTNGADAGNSTTEANSNANDASGNEKEQVGDLPSSGDSSKPFSRTVELQGISFTVESENSSSINKLKITPKGLEGSNDVIETEIDGGVVGAEVADLDVDGSPELYVYVISAGSGSYGTVVGYAANKKKSLSEINFPEMKEGSDELKGYMGHDEFAIVENALVRRFPIYKEGDSNAKPTGGTRQISYNLKQGEAAWQLVAEKVTDY